ncbi:hypothetical protein FKW77_008236 [Venturia effusa]|uniref:Uncharacterized protein n=1 Tax=Venturia effusa TaxID=50376 RepID=A0A517LCN9_9PEZI|nr:hypothetical protein FKW77_008236 [Venturia effusa]
MAQQEAGNIRPETVAKPVASVNNGSKMTIVKNKSNTIAPNQAKTVTFKAKPITQTKVKAAPKSAPKSAPKTKITGQQLQKVARFDWLLRSFLNNLNSLYDEFGGIPDQIKIVNVGIGRHHAQAVVDGYTGEAEDDEGSDLSPQIDVNKLLVANSWDESKRLKGPNIPKPMPGHVRLTTQEFSNQGLRPQPPQYTMDADGDIHLAEPVYQKPEHILQILAQLQNSPLGFTSDTPASATPNISVKDGNVTLGPAQWDIVKDCLTVVHYMNDHSPIGSVDMYQEARASWIRMFGWAPGLDEMIQAKQRAQEFRKEEGIHINALGTRVWISEEKGARERGDCAVFRPEMKQEGPAAPEAPKASEAPKAPITATATAHQSGVPHTQAIIDTATAFGSVREHDESAVTEAKLLKLRAAIDVNGKAFHPTRNSSINMGPVLPSMAAHTLIYHHPRPVPATPPSSPTSRIQVIDLSSDEATADTQTLPAMPSMSARSQAAVGVGVYAASSIAEKRGQHAGLNATTSESMGSLNPTTSKSVGSLIPARDPALHHETNSQDNTRKRKALLSSSSTLTGPSKRQAMGFDAHPQAIVGAEGLIGLDMTSTGMVPGVAPGVNEYIRWEDERNIRKKEKNDARLKAVGGRGVDQDGILQ